MNENDDWVLDSEGYGRGLIIDWSGIIICGAIATITAFATLMLI